MTEISPAEVVFFAALERVTAVERAAYLDAACAGDPALRSRVEKLLAAHLRVGGFLEPRPADGATADAPAEGQTTPFNPDTGSTADFAGKDEHVGAILGSKYKLIEAIGEGGWAACSSPSSRNR